MEANTGKNAKYAEFLGKLFSFNVSLKLFHWHIVGKGSYAEHVAIDQALESMNGALDRIVETSYALYGDIEISVPQANLPSNLVKHLEDFYAYVESKYDMFHESFSKAILDDYQEAIQQLLYRVRRLS